MPKVKKIRAPALQSSKAASSSTSRRGGHEQPLGQIIQDDTNRNLYATSKSNRFSNPNVKVNSALNKNKASNIDIDDDEYYDDNDDHTRDVVLDEKSSQRIIALSVEQQKEIRQTELLQNTAASTTIRKSGQQSPSRNNPTVNDSDDDEDNEDDDDDLINNNSNDNHFQYADRIENGEYVDMVDATQMGISPEDEAIIASMMKGRNTTTNATSSHQSLLEGTPPPQKTLADMILEKIAQKEQQQLQRGSRNDMDDNDMMSQPQELPPKVVEVYTDIGKILSRYTSGKLPKAFKVIPSLSNWEDVLYITRPDLWTPAAMYAATRIFASNCNVKMATKFYNLVLLDSIRNDIYKNKKLNYHYYMALKKSIYKPQSFFKGILLPLCQENCTLREAAIVASVLQRISIPVHHAAVAIHKLATMHQIETTSAILLSEYSGATSIFLKTLFNKKYSLPAPVIASVIRYFTNFLHSNPTNTGSHNKSNGTAASTTIVLPVLWHQALLVFIQRYKNAIHLEDTSTRDTFRKLLKQHYHHKITPEIRRELFGSIQAYQDELRDTNRSSSAAAGRSVPTSIQSQPMEM